MKALISLLLLIVCLSACLKDEPFKLAYNGFEPRRINDGWQISTPENENINSNILEKAYRLVYQDDRYTMARSLLVFRNGKLVAEAYPHDTDDIDRINNIQSCTKSFTSIMLGIALQNNLIDSLGERLYDIYPEHFDADVDKQTMTIEDALTMQTGLAFDNGSHTLELYQNESNSVKYVLEQDRMYAPGTLMNYNDGAPQLVSKAIEVKTGMPMHDYAEAKLFYPLNITNWQWESANDGTTFGAFSLFLKPRDFGKIGQLLLQQGMWKNERIIDSIYLAEAVSTKVLANFNNEPYGYYFWTLPTYNAFCALGHGGQFLLVVPDKNLVVVYTAWPYTSGNFFDQKSELMRIIINSCN